MANFLLIIQTVSQLLPLISGLVQSVEAAFPNTSGTGKLGAVQSLLQSAFNELGHIGVSFEQVWPTISAFVNATVAIYNASGLFKHAAPAINTTVAQVTQAGDTLAASVAASVQAPSPIVIDPVPVVTSPAPVAGTGPFASAASSLTSPAPSPAS